MEHIATITGKAILVGPEGPFVSSYCMRSVSWVLIDAQLSQGPSELVEVFPVNLTSRLGSVKAADYKVSIEGTKEAVALEDLFQVSVVTVVHSSYTKNVE